MVRTFLKVYMEIGSSFLFLQEQIKDIIIINKFWPRVVRSDSDADSDSDAAGLAASDDSD